MAHSDGSFRSLTHDGVSIRWGSDRWGRRDGYDAVEGYEGDDRRWRIEAAELRGAGDTLHRPRVVYDTLYVRPDDGPWHEVDAETGEATEACDGRSVPLPEGTLAFPHTVKRATEYEGALVVALAPPAADEDAYHVTELDAVADDATPVDGAAEFGRLDEFRPILAFDRSGAIRWQVDEFEWNGETMTHPRAVFRRFDDRLRTDLWGTNFFFIDRATGRITEAHWKR